MGPHIGESFGIDLDAPSVGLSRRPSIRPFSRGTLCHFRLPTHRAHPGQDVAGSHGRLGGADRGIRCQATARRPRLHPRCSVPAGARTRSNLLGHALRKAVGLAAKALATSAEVLMAEAGLALVGPEPVSKPHWILIGGHPPPRASALRLVLAEVERWKKLARSSSNASRRRRRPCRKCWRPSSRLSRRILRQTRREDRADGASSSTWPPTAASPLEDAAMRHGRTSSAKTFKRLQRAHGPGLGQQCHA